MISNIGELRKACKCLYLEVDKAIADDIKAKAEAVIKEAEEWKRRAEQHGCNVVDGDEDCG